MSKENSGDKLEKGAIRVFIVAFFTFFLVGNFPDASQAYFLYEIAEDAALSAGQMSLLASAAVIGLTCTCLFAGILMDKFSPRLVMGISIVIGGLGVVGRGFGNSFTALMAAFLLTGAMMGVYYFGVNKIITLWFSKKHLLFANAAMQSGAAIGFFIALQTCGQLAEIFGGWQNYFKVLGIAMVAVGFLWFTIVPERFSKDAVLNESVGVIGTEDTSFFKNLKYVLSSKKVWLCIISFTGFGNYVALISAYTATVLQMSANWGLDADTAAGVQSFGNVGSLIGYYIIPLLLMKFCKDRSSAGISTVCMAISVTLCIYGLLSGNPTVYTYIFVICGFCNGLGYTAPMTYMLEQPEVGGLRSGVAIGVYTLINQGVQIIGMTTIGVAFTAAPGMEDVVFAKYLGAFGGVGILAMLVFAIVEHKQEKRNVK